jgi:antitoxin ChpS
VHTTNLRKVGGSVMLSVPPAILDLLHLKAGSTVGLEVDGDRLVIATQVRSRYALDDLLAQCDADAPLPEEDREWIGLPSVGREL